MGAVRGRRDEMLIVRGVNLYPSEVEHALLHVEGAAPHYQLVLERPDALDELTVRCEPVDAGIDGEALRARIAHALRERTGIGDRRRAARARRRPAQRGQGGTTSSTGAPADAFAYFRGH